MDRTFVLIASLLAMAAVILGAFGAHALRDRLGPEDLVIFETGVRYHMYHALGLFGVAWAASRWPSGLTAAAGWLITAGVLVFSGSLYVLVLTGPRWLGAVTPIGGLMMISGWASLAWAVFRG